MCDAQWEFDWCVQSAKCRWWRHQQESLLILQSQNATDFWQPIGQLGVNNNQKSQIQWEIIWEDGSISQDQQKWQQEISKLLNPSGDPQDSFPAMPKAQEVKECGINEPINRMELLQALVKA